MIMVTTPPVSFLILSTAKYYSTLPNRWLRLLVQAQVVRRRKPDTGVILSVCVRKPDHRAWAPLAAANNLYMRTIYKPLALTKGHRRHKVLNAQKVLARGRGSRNSKVDRQQIHSRPRCLARRPRVRDLEEISFSVVFHQTLCSVRQFGKKYLPRPFVEDGSLNITLVIWPRHHESDLTSSKDSGCLYSIGIVNGEGAAAASDVCVFGPVDGKGFEPEVVVGSGIARDVADVLELSRNGVVYYEAVEYI
jgi:hypothetical protein